MPAYDHDGWQADWAKAAKRIAVEESDIRIACIESIDDCGKVFPVLMARVNGKVTYLRSVDGKG